MKYLCPCDWMNLIVVWLQDLNFVANNDGLKGLFAYFHFVVSNASSLMQMFKFRIKYHCLLPMNQLITGKKYRM